MLSALLRLNPFGTGQCLTTEALELVKGKVSSQSLWNRAVSYDDFQRVDMEIVKSQSLWNRAVSYDLTETQIENQNLRLNPFGTGQCLTTAVGSSSLVRQGLPKPLPNFFRDSESWVLIWLNVEQILTFHLHTKRSKTWSILPEF